MIEQVPFVGIALPVFTVAAYHEFDLCDSAPTACPDPLVCAQDPQIVRVGKKQTVSSACEYPCTTSADCPDPQTTCVSAVIADGGALNLCQINSCDPSNPSDAGSNGSINGTCNATGTNDGTCLPFLYATAAGFDGTNQGGSSTVLPQWACVRAGISDGGCVWPSAFASTASTCPQSEVCTSMTGVIDDLIQTYPFAQSLPPDQYVGQCAPLCDTSAKVSGCAAGTQCILVNEALGAQGPSKAANGATTGACLADGGAGCFYGFGATEYSACNNSGDCACPETCVADANLGSVCEAACNFDSDCPSSGDTCTANVCQPRFCFIDNQSNDAGGTINGNCTVDAGNDGICVPTFDIKSPNQFNFGICYLTGTATSSCQPAADNAAADLCPTGTFCAFGQCQQLCDPSVGNCDAGVACVQLNQTGNGQNPAPAGACISGCVAQDSYCINNGDCCSGVCDNPKAVNGLGPGAGNGTCAAAPPPPPPPPQ